MTQYKVSIKNPMNFPADERRRAGIVVSKDEGYTSELTDEQLAEIKADHELTVDGPKAASRPAAPRKRQAASKPAQLPAAPAASATPAGNAPSAPVQPQA